MTMGCASRRFAVPVAAILLMAPNVSAGAGTGLRTNPAAPLAAAAGHSARVHLRAVASRARDGQAETATLELSGAKRLDRTCLADLCSGTWFDGTSLAAFGINGTPTPESEADSKIERTFASIASTEFAEPEFIAAGGSVSALPSAGDEPQLRYRVTAPQGAELIAVADPKMRRLIRVEFPDRTPFARLIASGSGSTTVYATRSYDRVEAVESPIIPPAGPHLATTEAPDVVLLSGALPIVPCTLGGRPASCLIDTGTTPSAVTLDFAEQLGQEPHGRIEIAGLGTYLTGVIDAGPLAFGGTTFDRLSLAVIPRARGAAFDVILGSDALCELRIVFDLKRRRARIAATQTPAAGNAIPVTFSGGLPFAEVKLGTRDRSEQMLVDTGDSGLLSIGYDEFRQDMGLFPVRGSASAIGLGAVSMDTLQGELGHADIGGTPIDGAPISAVRGQHVGHIGYGFASRCEQFVLDLGRHQIECFIKSVPGKHSTGDP